MDLSTVIALIPPQYLIYLPLLPLFISLLTWGLKAALGVPSPSDSQWKRIGFAVAKALDVLAVNTRKVVDADKLAKLEKQNGENERALFKQAEKLAAKDRLISTHESTIAKQAVTVRQTLGIKGRP